MNTTAITQQSPAERGVVEYVPLGCQDPIKLSAQYVLKYVASPTRSGKLPGERDAIKFVLLCRSKRLNPFEGDCYLVGYDSKDGPQFSLITAHQAYLKRAELHPEFDGMESGVVVDEDGSIKDIEGDFHTDNQKVVGGWARVHFKTRKHPTYRRIRMSTFRKDYGQWNSNSAGMIVKCAEADALRSSFPTMLGGLYMKDEVESGIHFPSLPDATAMPPAPQQAEQPKLTVVKESDEIPGAETPSHTATMKAAVAAADAALVMTPQAELQDLVLAHGFSLDDFKAWAGKTGQLKDADDLTSFEDLGDGEAKRFLRAQKGLLTQLSAAKGQA